MNKLPFNITTILSPEEFRLKEKGSLFISCLLHVESEESANNLIKVSRKKFFDAAHNCYAYKFADGKTKYSDDGEPNGTAGLRILNAINHEKLFNVLIVVTRYFGGTKLGIGPLSKAYYDSAFNVIEKANKIPQKLYSGVIISFQYEFANLVHRTITNHMALIEETIFENSTKIIALVPSDRLDKFFHELLKNSLQKVEVKKNNTRRYL